MDDQGVINGEELVHRTHGNITSSSSVPEKVV